MNFNLERPPNKDGYTVPSTTQEGILSLAVENYRGHEIEVGRDSRAWGRAATMVLNPNAPAWTPGQGRSREHEEGAGRSALRAGMHQRGGWKGSRAGEPSRSRTGRNPTGGKYQVNYIKPRVRRAIRKKQIKRQKEEKRRGRAAQAG